MILRLDRIYKLEDCTIGKLFVDNVFEAFTLEDPVRADGVKVQDRTAIPPGAYDVVIDYSNRFKRLMPHILEVPMFSGIRIHSGNTAEDTSGCILVGAVYNKGEHRILQSRKAYDKLYTKLVEANEIMIWIDAGYNRPRRTLTGADTIPPAFIVGRDARET